MKVKAYVFVRGERGRSALLAPGDTVPDWASVTNPDVIDGDTADETPEEDPEPAPAPAPRKRTAPKKETSE